MQDVFVPLVVIVILVVLNGLFVAAEFALVASRRSRLNTLADTGNPAARWLTAVFDDETGKDRYIAIAQLGITLASIGLGMYGEPVIASWLYGPFEGAGLSYAAAHTAGFIIALSAITFMHVVFGEMIPKALALQAPEAVSLQVNPLMRVFGFLFRPLIILLNVLALGLMRALRIREPGKNAFLYTSKELSIITDESAESGQLGGVQRDLIQNIFALEDRTAQELMTPRSSLEALSIHAPPDEVTRRIAGSPRSRYPVYEDNLDEIIGVLHVKDFIRARVSGGSPQLGRLIRPLPSVAASTSAEHLLALFKRERLHAALVVDEFGGTLGFVTMDDLIEDVMEEEDAGSSDWVQTNPDGSLILNGEVTLSELREDHGLNLHSEDATTIAGLLLGEYGTVPAAGTTVFVQGHDLTAEDVQGLKITRVRVRPVASPDEVSTTGTS
ncbi:hemolysin family protein [Deinococcus deserti]|uniref:Putative hemolysin putative membrane protein n=1 Tax=Deinococcus deserti (strain DSM 17065 / CIP 109153 / LMG 22923 / VCD115) TaxID=546414 RepID=C1D3R2_DEIDV|nr:hemolysin family protein [Deinococcus deserti]ACO48141.1 putative hemolysin; putative membrane protein [Deinococcus deserti VCD115]